MLTSVSGESTHVAARSRMAHRSTRHQCAHKRTLQPQVLRQLRGLPLLQRQLSVASAMAGTPDVVWTIGVTASQLPSRVLIVRGTRIPRTRRVSALAGTLGARVPSGTSAAGSSERTPVTKRMMPTASGSGSQRRQALAFAGAQTPAVQKSPLNTPMLISGRWRLHANGKSLKVPTASGFLLVLQESAQAKISSAQGRLT